MYSTNHKILCTGNPNKGTLAKGIREVFPDADFVHLSNGYDFTTQAGLDKFREKIKDYNLFINASRINLGVQLSLLKITREEWLAGHVFNIGSVLEYEHFSWFDPKVTEDKLILRAASIDMCSEKFKTTHIIMGGCKDESPNKDVKMDPASVAKIIQWIANAPNIHIPIIGIENDYWISDWQEQKNKGRNGVYR